MLMISSNRAERKNSLTKKILSLIVAFTIVFGCFGSVVPVFAVDDIASGTCNADISWVIDSNGILTVSGIGAIPDYNLYAGETDAPWFNYYNNITGIIIGENITKIGSCAFGGFKNLSNRISQLSFPSTLTEIASSAFSETYFDCDLIIPDSVVSIGRSAFSGNYGTFKNHTLKLPDNPSFTEIKEHTFCNANFAGELLLPESITLISDHAFYGCNFTGTLNVPVSVTLIEVYAFGACNFSSICFADNSELKYIGNYAFYENQYLRGELVLPDGLETIGSLAFFSCTSNIYSSEHKGEGLTGNLHIPASVTYIGDKAFHGSYWLDGKLIIDNPNVTVGQCAFHGCAQACGNIISFFEDYPQYIDIQTKYVSDSGKENKFAYCTDCGNALCSVTALISPMLIEKGKYEDVSSNIGEFSMDTTPETILVSDPTIANVTSEGKIEGINAGTGEVELKINDNINDSAELTVFDVDVEIGSIEIGQPLDITYSCEPSSVVIDSCQYSSSNTYVLKIESGVPVVKHTGTSKLTITINVSKGSLTKQIRKEFDIVVTKKITNITLNTFDDKYDLYTNNDDTIILLCKEGTNTPATFTESPFVFGNSYNMLEMNFTTLQADEGGTVINGVTFYGTYLTYYNSLYMGFDGTNVVVPISTGAGGNQLVANNIVINKNSYSANDIITMDAGQTIGVEFVIEPSDSQYQNDSVSIANNKILSYDPDNNTITASYGGTTQLVYSYEDLDGTEHTYSWNVTISGDPYIPVESIIASPNSIIMNLNETELINASVNPNNASNQTVTFSSSDTNVATVDENGLITAVGHGTAVITVSGEEGTPAQISVIVEGSNIPVSSITVTQDDITMKIGDVETLAPIIEPNNASNPALSYTSSDPTVVTVDASGKITAIGNGNATVTISSVSNPDVTKEIDVTVYTPTTGIVVDDTPIIIKVGETKEVAASVQPNNAADQTLTYTTNNENVISINGNTITGVAPGTAILTIETADGIEKEIEVVIADVSAAYNKTKIVEGETAILTVAAVPFDKLTVKSINAVSSDPTVATVDENGNVTAINNGNAVVTLNITLEDENNTETVITKTVDIHVHNPGEPVHENDVYDETGDGTYAFELNTYCQEDGDLVDHHVVTLERKPANDPDVNNTGNIEYFEGSNGKNYVWDDNTNKYVESDNVTIPKTAVESVDGTPATETEHGQRDHFKDGDGNLYVLENGIYVPVTEADLVIHNVVEIRINEVAVGCVTNGSYDLMNHCTCTGCDKDDEYVKHVTIPALGHDWSVTAENVTTAPTCTSAGSKTTDYECVRCHETMTNTESVKALGHTDSDKDGYCDVCDEEIGWHCSKCDWYNENKDKGGVFGIVVKIVHVIVHMIESIHKLT